MQPSWRSWGLSPLSRVTSWQQRSWPRPRKSHSRAQTLTQDKAPIYGLPPVDSLGIFYRTNSLRATELSKGHCRGLEATSFQGSEQKSKNTSLIPTSDNYIQFSSVQSFSRVRLLVTPWTAARQASLSITNSWSLLKFMFIESVMPSSHLILCRPLLLLPPIPLSIRVFSMSQFFEWGGQSTGVSASASVLPMNTQDWSPSGWTAWIFLESKGLSRAFSNTTLQKHQFFSAQLSL